MKLGRPPVGPALFQPIGSKPLLPAFGVHQCSPHYDW
jgi:hypothetical protein